MYICMLLFINTCLFLSFLDPHRLGAALDSALGRKHLQVALPVISIRELNAKGWPSLNPIPIRTPSSGLRFESFAKLESFVLLG